MIYTYEHSDAAIVSNDFNPSSRHIFVASTPDVLPQKIISRRPRHFTHASMDFRQFIPTMANRCIPSILDRELYHTQTLASLPYNAKDKHHVHANEFSSSPPRGQKRTESDSIEGGTTLPAIR